MPIRNKRCIICNKLSYGRLCRECYQRNKRDNIKHRENILDLRRYTQYNIYSQTNK